MVAPLNPTAPRFRVIDTASSRADLVRRKEIKFVVPGADVGKLRRVLEGSCRSVIHNDRVSTVRSVYFDDLHLSACRANLDGLAQRKKLRLRWYDRPQPRNEFYFEIKWRDNRVTGKHRFQIQSQDPVSQLTYRQIVDELERRLPRVHLGILHTFFEPKVLVQYKREHFVARGTGSLRLTIDYDLAFYDQSARQRICSTFGVPLHDLVVVEGKTPVNRESELRDLLAPFTPRASRCSKYVHGCQALGLISVND